ncbi:hypothetical protein O7634_24545 [Micromonospora sp. WMMD1120]|uniref:hypothetical protein n=1 Tax=Micromonospora sp. WMMD1120 TaxID=3016106 RepID=UPI0024176114|nr:hypothetical protein [Micromonospora sp. WMMD1120]MDG4809933.1 hypothetical protein [Micromonospora sp. WMMD1120]
MSRSWEGGSTRAWRRTRALVLVRDGYLCQLRLPGVCTTTATHVHHTAGRSVTGDDPAYLVASCAPCNLKLGDPTKLADRPNKAVTKW